VNVRDITPYIRTHLSGFSTSGNKVWSTRLPYESIGVLTQQAATDTSAAYYFAGSGCVGFADYITVFDQYRIMAVSVTFSPRLAMGMFTSSDVNPRLWTVIDYDDATVIGRSTIQQYETLVTSPPATGVTRVLQPHIASAVYSGGTTSYANDTNRWIDAASNTVQHYGIKAVLENGSVSQTNLQSYVIDAFIYVQFRNSR